MTEQQRGTRTPIMDRIQAAANVRQLVDSFAQPVRGMADLTGLPCLRRGFMLRVTTEGTYQIVIVRTDDARHEPLQTALEADDLDRMEAKLQDLALLQRAISATITEALNEKGTGHAA